MSRAMVQANDTGNLYLGNLVLSPLYHCQAGTLGWKIGKVGGTNPPQW